GKSLWSAIKVRGLAISTALQQGLLGLSEGGRLGTIISILMYLTFFIFILFGQRIQLRMMLWEIDGFLKRLDAMRSEARRKAIEMVREIGKPKEDPTPHVDSLLEQFLIMPVDLDPAGIIWKIDHLLDVRDMKFKDDIRRIAPEANEAQVNNLENLVEASLALNTIFRIVRHFYLLGKRTSSFYIILQLQMILPLVMQEAEALMGATKAFALGQPIGDGIGPLVISKLISGLEKRRIEKDMVMGETYIEGRKVIALKAEGPGGNVGKPGDAIRKIIEELEGRVSAIIMVDAALKFEGERSGEISNGIGAAIGGIGTERFKIEEEASKFKIPLYAVVIKESIIDAITPMKKEISESADRAIEAIRRLILDRTKEGDTVIVAGIGNTIGIGQ
ncbi:MAG: DUF1512 domain-containing protein, partial [Candidatus Bathyarchaeia archaeon]